MALSLIRRTESRSVTVALKWQALRHRDFQSGKQLHGVEVSDECLPQPYDRAKVGLIWEGPRCILISLAKLYGPSACIYLI